VSPAVHVDAPKRFSLQFRVAIEATPTGMVMVDQAGEIAFVNVRAEELFGYAVQCIQ
jgi:PAS domain S-box-containing protein